MVHKSCVECGAPIPAGSSTIRMYCGDQCKKKAYYQRKKAEKAVAKMPDIADGVRRMRELDALAKNGDDPIYTEFRRLLSDALRTNITRYVQDQLLGSGEILTGMVPKALAILSDEMESDNDYVRSRAVAATMKYAMAFKDSSGANENLGTINVLHNMGPVPDTPLGHATLAASAAIDAKHATQQARIESGDIVLEECAMCHEAKHPDTLRASGHKGGARLCSSCWLQLEHRNGPLDPASFMTRDPEFGIEY